MPRNGSILTPTRRATGFVVRRRFQGIIGKRRTNEILPVLSEANAAYMGLKLAAPTIRGKGAHVFTQWVGDPDALGSAILLRAVLLELGAREVRILTGSLGHPQNYKLVELAHITLHSPNAGRIRGGLHCMVDTSPPLGMTNTTGVDPVSDYFFVADHHAEPEDIEENCRLRNVKRRAVALRGAGGGVDVGVHGSGRRRLRRPGDAHPGRARRRGAGHLHGHERTAARGDPPRLQDVRAAHPARGDPDDPRRASRLPGAARVAPLSCRGVQEPGGHRGHSGGAGRVHPRRAPGRPRRGGERAVAGSRRPPSAWQSVSRPGA